MQPRDVGTAAAAAFVLIASRVVSDDRLEVVLRVEHAGTTDSARAFAVQLLLGARERVAGPVCIDVQDGRGVPVCFVSTEVRS